MKELKVAIDKGPLTSGHRVRGVGVYVRELIKALEQESKRVKELEVEAVDFEKANLTKYDLVHYPYFNPFFITLPFNKPTKIVVTIHDLIPLIYPKHYPPGIKGNLRFLLQKFLIQNVDGIIAPSETSKKDIVRFLGVSSEKIQVIYEAPRDIFKKLEIGNWKLEIQKRYGLPERFVLYVGDVNYNKNVMGLIRACKVAKTPLAICGKQAKEIEDYQVGLNELTGPRDWLRFIFNHPHPELAHYKKLADEFRGNSKILRLGFVPDADLVAIYNLATIYCQPSFYEGFGLPVLEAMACGCPVVSARTQALVEVAGDAAAYVDPKDPADIAQKISKFFKNEKTRARLSKAGLKQVKKYSWHKTAEATIKVYENVGRL